MQNNYLFYDDSHDEELSNQSSWLRVAQQQRQQQKREEPCGLAFANNDTLSPPRIKKSRSLDLGRLRRQNIQHQSEYTHEAVLGQYSGRWRSSKGDLCELMGMTDSFDYSDCSCSPKFDSSVSDTDRTEDNVIIRMMGDRKKWTVGRVSVLMLLLFTVTDFAIHVVNAQMETLESPDYYDALSAEVIRPAFRYHSAKADKLAERPKLALGAAAISSVTEALSPILPFTGGLDLRREDYWTNGWFGSVSSVYHQVRDAFGVGATSDRPTAFMGDMPRGGAKVSVQSKTRESKTSAPRHAFSLSEATPFVPLSEIADMTLTDLSMAFRYALENTRDDFNSAKFFQGMVPRMKKVVGAMSDAVSKSRGKGILSARTGILEPVETGNIDALHFCAAMRIFAEWRVLRQVPEGYKGYAVGMNLGQKDVIQNVAKIEQAVHQWIDREVFECEEACDPSDIRSPTLRQLLEYEIEIDVHDNTKLPRLKDKTGAMGLLWVRRQLQYQTALFANVVRVPTVFENTNAAVSAAYSEVYDKYHGWAVQKIFNYSFKAAPDPTEIYKVMNPHRLKEVVSSYMNGVRTTSDVQQKEEHVDDNANPFEKFGRHVGNEWDKFGKHIGGEWDKLAGSVVRLFDDSAQPAAGNDIMPLGDVELSESQQIEMEQLVAKEMEKDAHDNIHSYLEVVQPLLKNLDGLFDELNMEDPTKV